MRTRIKKVSIYVSIGTLLLCNVMHAQNVGIGTTIANGRLQFKNEIFTRMLVLNESGNNDNNFFGFGINEFTLRYQVADPAQSHVFFAGNAQNAATGSNELFRIQGNGNIGIGNSTPNGRLQFRNETFNKMLVLNESGNNDHNFFGFGINQFTLRYQVADPAQSHVFFAGNTAFNATSSNELFRIRGNGNVGIGQPLPNAPLQFSNAQAPRKIVLHEFQNNDFQFYGFGFTNGMLRYQTATINDDHVFFSGQSSTASNEIMRIKGNGNVGIGTGAANGRLQFKNEINNRIIVLNESALNEHNFFGFGINNFTLRYQIADADQSHVFYAGTSATASNELFRIRGNGNIGIGQSNPQVPLHFATTGGKKISLYRGPFGDAGFGVFGNELRIHSDYNGADITFGYDSLPSFFTERMRIKANGNVGIGTANPQAPLHFATDTRNRKIVLWSVAENDHQFYGFGVNDFAQRYQVSATADDHVFYAAVNSTSSIELMRIKGNGNIGIKQSNPGVYGHGGTAKAMEIWNNSGDGSDVQSHLVLSTSGRSGSMGGVTWATTALGGEQKAAFIGAAYESGTNNALFQVLLRNNGNLAQRFRVNSNGNAWLQGTLTQNSDATLKKNIEPIANATGLLQQLHGYRYEWKDEHADADKQLGLLAQEVQKVLPELVKEGDNGKLGVNYSGLIPVLLEALKE